MSQQGPILVVSPGEPPPFASALHDAELVPVVPCSWADASRSLAQLAPAAVVVAASAAAEIGLEALARQVAETRLYLPLIVLDPTTSLPGNAIPCTQSGGKFDRLIARLRSAIRVRTLHSTVMRRLDGGAAAHATFDDADPARDPTVLLIGRGAAYPSLSVALGERMGVVGALRIEAAAKHLTTRDIDGI
ncbi:MAG: GGDEF domain-containing protein, partial [Bradyrhizobium sp.]